MLSEEARRRQHKQGQLQRTHEAGLSSRAWGTMCPGVALLAADAVLLWWLQTGRNIVHGSDSPENGERETGESAAATLLCHV